MKPLYIFDLDGTLALTEHRQHLLDGDKPNWDGFFEACVWDEPNTAVIKTMQSLYHSGCEIWIWSGRSDAVRDKTNAWLSQNDLSYACSFLRMRKDGDFTPDDELKLSWLHELTPQDEARLVAIFDDRDKVVKMWRENGIPCFQVASGDF